MTLSSEDNERLKEFVRTFKEKLHRVLTAARSKDAENANLKKGLKDMARSQTSVQANKDEDTEGTLRDYIETLKAQHAAYKEKAKEEKEELSNKVSELTAEVNRLAEKEQEADRDRARTEQQPSTSAAASENDLTVDDVLNAVMTRDAKLTFIIDHIASQGNYLQEEQEQCQKSTSNEALERIQQATCRGATEVKRTVDWAEQSAGNSTELFVKSMGNMMALTSVEVCYRTPFNSGDDAVKFFYSPTGRQDAQELMKIARHMMSQRQPHEIVGTLANLTMTAEYRARCYVARRDFQLVSGSTVVPSILVQFLVAAIADRQKDGSHGTTSMLGFVQALRSTLAKSRRHQAYMLKTAVTDMRRRDEPLEESVVEGLEREIAEEEWD